MASLTHTPMIQQYLNIKEDYADAIVFFRLGDFYEMFFDDAVTASKVLDITLTSRHKESNIPMCGVPYHASSLYIQKLIKEGYKVAIAEQTSLPGQGLVSRSVTRVITPGTVLDETILTPGMHNFIAGLYADELGFYLSYLDVSTGQGFIQTFKQLEEVIGCLHKEHILEVVVEQDFPLPKTFIINHIDIPSNFQHSQHQQLPIPLKKATYLCLYYVHQTQQHPIDHIPAFKNLLEHTFVHMDERVLRHVELFESPSGKTLFRTLNKTRTSMGQRYLKHILMHPLRQLEDILERQRLISNFYDSKVLDTLYTYLDDVYDVYRITQRFAYNRATPKDMLQLKVSLMAIKKLKDHLNTYHEGIKILHEGMHDFDDLHDTLARSIREDAKTLVSEGGYIKEGYDADLDQLYFKQKHHDTWLDEYLETQKEITGIKQLKIGYQRITGYYIEVTKGQIKSMDGQSGFERKQTLKNTERYTTEALKAHQIEFESLETLITDKEIDIFNTLKKTILNDYDALLKTSFIISQVDVFSTLAHFFKRQKYIKPEIQHESETHIEEARHPVLEQFMTFISNDIHLKTQEILMITGPNMGGKSTYMKMFALIVIMAQAGLYIPATRAKLKLYDAIYTRIGASDDIASGLSTFMTEMYETNIALSQATKDSLLIFDEIGRGTSTYDGMALAQGIIEYIHDEIKSHTLFSTHYHELTALELSLSHLNNVYVKAKVSQDEMIFLHQVLPGKSDRSYGVQVASLAKLPSSVIKRSKELLKHFETQSKIQNYDLFSLERSDTHHTNPAHEEILSLLEKTNVNQMTPIEALNLIQLLTQLAKKETSHD